MTEFSVQIDALVEVGDYFKKVAVDYKEDMSGGLERPSTGDPKSDAMLGTTLEMIDLLHNALADAVWQHGQKLRKVAEIFQTSEEANIATLYDAAVNASTTPGDLQSIRIVD